MAPLPLLLPPVPVKQPAGLGLLMQPPVPVERQEVLPPVRVARPEVLLWLLVLPQEQRVALFPEQPAVVIPSALLGVRES